MARLRQALMGTALLMLAVPALAQTKGWTDPPADLPPVPQQSAPAAPAPSPEPQTPQPAPAPPRQATSPAPEEPPREVARPSPPAAPEPKREAAEPRPAAPEPRRETAEPQTAAPESRHAAAARALLVDYLAAWSSDEAIAATRELYAPVVAFHGEVRSAKSVVAEKRRFVRRWPVRDYRPREDTIRVSCGGNGDLCTVRALFDYTAADPRRARRATGTSLIELIVSFREGEEPVIVGESSIPHGQLANEGRGSNRDGRP